MKKIWVEYQGEMCCYLREDSHLDFQIALGALNGLNALLWDLKSAKTKSFSAEEIGDILGCITEKLQRVMAETEAINTPDNKAA